MARTVIARSEHFFITEEPVETRIDDCDGCGDSNVLCTVEIIDGKRFLHCLDCNESDEYRTSEDDNEEFWAEPAEYTEYMKVAKFVSEPREDNPSFGHWEPSFIDWKAARENGGQS